MAVALFARREWLQAWSTTAKRVRWDYDTKEHVIEDMLDNAYWASVAAKTDRDDGIRDGDLIFITDARNERCTIEVSAVDVAKSRVLVSVIEKTEVRAVTKAGGIEEPYYVKWRGPRGGGWCLMRTGTDEVVDKDFASRDDAETRMGRKIIEDGAKAAA